jgi:HSP20 family protein
MAEQRDVNQAITKRRPTALERLQHDVEEMRRHMSGLFKSPMFESIEDSLLGIDWSPSVDAYEEGGGFVVKADLPGVKKEDVTVSVDAGVLTIAGKRHEEREREGTRYFTAERFTGAFSRSFALPKGVKVDEIEAQYRDGVLEVRIPLPPAPRTPTTTIRVKG